MEGRGEGASASTCWPYFTVLSSGCSMHRALACSPAAVVDEMRRTWIGHVKSLARRLLKRFDMGSSEGRHAMQEMLIDAYLEFRLR